MSIRIAATILVVVVLLGGCETAPDSEVADGSPRWELPNTLPSAFSRQFPGSEVLTWNRLVGADNDVSYHIIYAAPDGQRREVWLSPTGQVIPPPSPWENRPE